MAKVSPGPSVHLDYKKENPVNENDTSSTNNNWFYNIQFVAITILFFLLESKCTDGPGDTFAIKIVAHFVQPGLFTENLQLF